MKFLVITKMRHPVSPDIAMGLFDDLITWSKKYVCPGCRIWERPETKRWPRPFARS